MIRGCAVRIIVHERGERASRSTRASVDEAIQPKWVHPVHRVVHDVGVEKYRKPAPKLAEWMETNVPEGLHVVALPDAHRRRMRTVNGLERVNGELHRRTRVATLFPNEPSLLRLVSALAAEISEEWETGRAYLAPSAEPDRIGSRGGPRSDDLDSARSSPVPPGRSKMRTREPRPSDEGERTERHLTALLQKRSCLIRRYSGEPAAMGIKRATPADLSTRKTASDAATPSSEYAEP